MSTPLRERIIGAAAAITAAEGWSRVTMSRVAAAVGVSRQTVYNEVGDKDALAQALVLTELGRVLEVVHRAFDEQPADPVRAAVEGVLTLARDDDLVRAIVTSAHGGDSELLPFLTTRADGVIAAADAVVGERLAARLSGLTSRRRDAIVDALVRVVLSHVMRPAAEPVETAREIAWWFDRAVEA